MTPRFLRHKVARSQLQSTACPLRGRREDGFTLIELLLSLGILASISIFAITTLSGQVDMRNRLETLNSSQHALNVAMDKIFNDMRHAYVLSKQDAVIGNMSGRAVKPALVFRSAVTGVYFSTQNYRSFIANSPQSNLAFVRYFERQDPKDSSKKQFVRMLDTDMKESIERDGVGQEQLLLTDLSEFKITFWNGADFTSEWDTSSGESNGKLPKMAKIKIGMNMPVSDAEKQRQELNPNAARETQTISLESIVYLLYSVGQTDVKEPSKEYKWH